MVNREGVLSSAPLYLVLCGVRFRLRESLPAWIGDIQERLYTAGFTRLSRVRQSQAPGGFELAIDPVDFDQAQAGAAYLFSREDRGVSIQIHKAGLTVFSRSYSHFQEFAVDVSSAVDAILASAKHLEVETIGIRYLDFIRPKNGELLSQYISQGLLPFEPDWSDWNGSVMTGTNVNTYSVDNDQLVVRCVGAGHPVVPPDLAMAYVTSFSVADIPSEMIPTIEPQQGTLDIDAVRVGSVLKADRAEQIVNEVRRLHGLANDFFRSVCTEHAFSRWNEES
jgi:uncharacterized protein (TIGR04255 family)